MSGARPTPPEGSEAARVADRYARRIDAVDPSRYDPLRPAVYLAVQERERALIRLLQRAGLPPLAGRTVLDVGCGSGDALLELVRMGFAPGHLTGVELLPERAATARARLPSAVRLLEGDAGAIELPPASFDVVLQSTVFTSLLDHGFQTLLAQRMWSWAKPGGGIVWYDFTWDNPANPDVRGVPLRRIRELFPEGRVEHHRVTLAPPLARLVTRVHPALYGALNALPFLRTHLLCWIRKP